MKLAQQYTRASIIITFSILFFAGIIYYVAISYISNNQLDRDLTEEIDEVTYYVNHNHKMPTPVDFDDDAAAFAPIGQRTVQRHFVNMPFVEPHSKKTEPGRAVIDMIRLNGINYQVSITESKEGTEYLAQIIAFITIALTAILLAALFFTNRYILNGLWQPFYKLLGGLKSFSVANNMEYSYAEYPVKADEFRELREAIDTMATRARGDYQTLKNFTENASHEMMTPLAVIASKLDTLIQDENLNAAHYEQLYNISLSINKLSRLNQSLLLLVKIDNKQIKDSALINLKELIDEKVNQFQEMIANKEITVTCELATKNIYASQYLVDILLNNLLSNAVRHNIKGGRINIRLDASHLVVENTSPQPALDETKIFERFEKGKASEGMGLGLTIARNICNNYTFDLSYSFAGPFHRFTVRF